MKYLKPGASVTFRRGGLSYEGKIVDRDDVVPNDGGNRIVCYQVDVAAPGGGPVVDRVLIHDQQIIRAYNVAAEGSGQ